MKSIAIIGAGNVATFLAKSLFDTGHSISAIFNRTLTKAQTIASMVNSVAIDNIQLMHTSSDLYLICVSDDAIGQIVDQLSIVISPSSIVAHVSGNCSIDVVRQQFNNGGVLWPVQSISGGIEVGEVPFCVSATNTVTEQDLSLVANTISKNVFIMPDADRTKLHLPAAMVNNFVNYINHLAFDYCQSNGLPFEALYPLMKQTLKAGINNGDPIESQTGPAFRNDRSTINKHIEYLGGHNELRLLYQYLTNRIRKHATKQESTS